MKKSAVPPKKKGAEIRSPKATRAAAAAAANTVTTNSVGSGRQGQVHHQASKESPTVSRSPVIPQLQIQSQPAQQSSTAGSGVQPPKPSQHLGSPLTPSSSTEQLLPNLQKRHSQLLLAQQGVGPRRAATPLPPDAGSRATSHAKPESTSEGTQQKTPQYHGLPSDNNNNNNSNATSSYGLTRSKISPLHRGAGSSRALGISSFSRGGGGSQRSMRRGKKSKQMIIKESVKKIQRWWRLQYYFRNFRKVVDLARAMAKREEMQRREHIAAAKLTLRNFFTLAAERIRQSKLVDGKNRKHRSAVIIQRFLLARRAQCVRQAKISDVKMMAAHTILRHWKTCPLKLRVEWGRQNREMLRLLECEESIEGREIQRQERIQLQLLVSNFDQICYAESQRSCSVNQSSPRRWTQVFRSHRASHQRDGVKLDPIASSMCESAAGMMSPLGRSGQFVSSRQLRRRGSSSVVAQNAQQQRKYSPSRASVASAGGDDKDRLSFSGSRIEEGEEDYTPVSFGDDAATSSLQPLCRTSSSVALRAAALTVLLGQMQKATAFSIDVAKPAAQQLHSRDSLSSLMGNGRSPSGSSAGDVSLLLQKGNGVAANADSAAAKNDKAGGRAKVGLSPSFMGVEWAEWFSEINFEDLFAAAYANPSSTSANQQLHDVRLDPLSRCCLQNESQNPGQKKTLLPPTIHRGRGGGATAVLSTNVLSVHALEYEVERLVVQEHFRRAWLGDQWLRLLIALLHLENACREQCAQQHLSR